MFLVKLTQVVSWKPRTLNIQPKLPEIPCEESNGTGIFWKILFFSAILPWAQFLRLLFDCVIFGFSNIIIYLAKLKSGASIVFIAFIEICLSYERNNLTSSSSFRQYQYKTREWNRFVFRSVSVNWKIPFTSAP